ncbi:MAG: hypothetical protein M5U14_09555 [Acidimicrobiia bacterium]|nr:hypothetical protein [Acidimicrobiia bacterium]
MEPAVEDRWARSSLRSIRVLLDHLAQRVELEGSVLHDDVADLRVVLPDLADLVVGAHAEPWPAWRADLEHALDHPWRESGAYPTVASLAAEREALRDLADRALRALHGADVDPAVRAEGLDRLGTYLRRQLAREQPMFLPAFLAPSF